MKIFLNGQLVEKEDAKISVMDRGFFFGDGVYEVIPVYNRRPFHVDEHWDRLQTSLDGIRLKNPYTKEQWNAELAKVIDALPEDDQYVYLQITRGSAPKRDHAFPAEVHPTILFINNPLPVLPDSYLEKGIKTITRPDIRWDNCHLKVTSLQPGTLLRQDAIEAGATEAILLKDGILTEGAASNIVIVKDGKIISPKWDNRILHGITLKVVKDLADANNIPFEVRDITEDELRNADEVWLTASTKEVLPVTEIDGKPVGNGKPGPLVKKMHDIYQAHKAAIQSANG